MSEEKNRKKRIVGFFSAKGGVGKTTAAVLLARLAADRGHKPLVLDLDFIGTEVATYLRPPEKKRVPALFELLSGNEKHEDDTFAGFVGRRLGAWGDLPRRLPCAEIAGKRIRVWPSLASAPPGNVEERLPEVLADVWGVGLAMVRLRTLIKCLGYRSEFDYLLLDMFPFFIGYAGRLWESLGRPDHGWPEYGWIANRVLVTTAEPRELVAAGARAGDAQGVLLVNLGNHALFNKYRGIDVVARQEEAEKYAGIFCEGRQNETDSVVRALRSFSGAYNGSAYIPVVSSLSELRQPTSVGEQERVWKDPRDAFETAMTATYISVTDDRAVPERSLLEWMDNASLVDSSRDRAVSSA